MNKKMIIALFIAIGLVMGGTFLSQKAYAASHTCWVPYCIKTGNWGTGLNITANYYSSEELTIYFWTVGGTGPYATATLDFSTNVGGWTGMVEDLLSVPANFQSPSLLIFYSSSGEFMVTQFVMNAGSVGGGFGFQTFYSWPVSSGWPNLIEPLPEPQGAEENIRTRLPAE